MESSPPTGVEDSDLVSAIDALVSLALKEDVGDGDRTTEWTVDPDCLAEAVVIAKEPLVFAGGNVARRVFHRLDPDLEVQSWVADGAAVEAGAEVLGVSGAARAILTGERIALNFLGRLSGIASLTKRFVDALGGLDAKITDTRKTTPGWRTLEKWAVRTGGAVNHRMGLDDMILVKDNHILAAGGIREAVVRATSRNDSGLPVEVEVADPAQVDAIRGLPIDRILLDNMEVASIEQVVRVVSTWPDPRPELEASGNMTLDRVRRVAEAGVDWISVGALTHSAATADFSMGIVRLTRPPGDAGARPQ